MSLFEQWKEKNYYELFGLSSNASKEEIKKAYKEIALVYHPDSNFFDEIIDENTNNEQDKIFKLLTAAYTVLMDEAKRRAYNETMVIEVEKWDEEEYDEEYFHEDKDYIESDTFSYSDLEQKYQERFFGSFGKVGKSKSNNSSKILSTMEVFKKQNNIFQQFLRLMGMS